MLLPLLLSSLTLANAFTECPGGYKNGDKIKQGQFVKQCNLSPNSYDISIVGCLSGKGTEIALGKSLKEGSVEYKCIATANGGAKIETDGFAGPKENLKCFGKYANGEKWTEDSFVSQCLSSPIYMNVTIVACLTPSGKEIPIGATEQEGQKVYTCIRRGKSGAELEANPATTTPTTTTTTTTTAAPTTTVTPTTTPKPDLKCEGKYKNGEKFKAESYVKLCTSNPDSANVTVVACLTPSGKEIAIGAKEEEGKYIYSCVKTKDGAKLEKELAKKGCEDGKHPTGKNYVSSDKKFIHKCLTDEGDNKIIACIIDGGKNVTVGEELAADGFFHKCVKEKDGSVKYVKEPIPTTAPPTTTPKPDLKCVEKYSNGEKFKEESYVKLCTSNPYSANVSIIACLTPSGKEIPIGAKEEEGKYIYSCVKTKDGAKLEKELAKKGCEDGKHPTGQNYISSDKKFIHKCLTDEGDNKIVACIIDGGKNVTVGEEVAADGYFHKCVKDKDGSVKYVKEAIPTTTTTPKPTTTKLRQCGQFAVGEHTISTDAKFRMTCAESGELEIFACIVEGGEVKVGTKQTIGEWVYECKNSPFGGQVSKKNVLSAGLH